MRAIIPLLIFAASLRADDWPQWHGPRRDAVWRDTGVLEKFPEAGPRIRWRMPVGGGYAGPAVAGGRVFVTDRQVKPGAAQPKNTFDRSAIVPGVERVLCFNEADGKLLWSHEYDCGYNHAYSSGPRCTPAVDGDRVYTLGAEGDLLCLNVENKKVLWQRKLSSDKTPTPIWGFAGHPLIDGDRLIVLGAGPGNVLLALNKMTGQTLWEAVEAREGGYAPPMIYTLGGKRQLILWHPQAIVSVEPETGKQLWRKPFGPVKNGVSIATPVAHEDKLLISSFHEGAMVLKCDGPEPVQLWKKGNDNPRRTQAIQNLMANMIIRGEHVFGICQSGELRCIELNTGNRVWESKALFGDEAPMWSTAFLVPNGDRYFIATDQGELILAGITPQGYTEISRAKLLEPNNRGARRPVVWSHPAFANKSMYWRNDGEIIAVDLAK